MTTDSTAAVSVEQAVLDAQAQDAARGVMAYVRGMLEATHLIGIRVQGTPDPVERPREYRMRMIAEMLNRKRDRVGTVWVDVLVPRDGVDPRVVFRWTRNAFGFWYVEQMEVPGAGEDAFNADYGLVRAAVRAAVQTATGAVRLQSMNRMHRTVRRSRQAERVAHRGLRLM